ncbi:hypothetical protein [Candidatus Nitrosocosmicus sp. SS]|uniref:hypothetical protein n=1 Tax=Candidatus Nitrosocosmicus agrestis TaxID=2563600 RepID=UPI00122E367E|nr:hypothetical protein [Candidatus Nitrosocosmicus sp. SS]KAA2282086.1 hypothetical protein F1Z66_06505 [Candidatus Nitrosocosmicus sp. SS]KAF0870069.1 hypothetical protein E5N71_02305 [Candidatus Nitrosocosmicus sp. SS]
MVSLGVITLIPLAFLVTPHDVSIAYAQGNFSSLNPYLIKNQSNQTLGPPIYTETTKSTNTRVLSIDPVPTVEVSYVGNSTMNRSTTQTIGTIVDKMGADGAVYSQGQAIILNENGQVFTYKTESKGYYNPDGSFTDNGVMMFDIPFQDSKESGSSSSNATSTNSTMNINNIFGIYKKTVDPLGKGFTKVWKWD